MSAKFWYVRSMDLKLVPAWRINKGAGWTRPPVLICGACDHANVFDVLVSCGPTCFRCGRELITEEQLDAAVAALKLGGTYQAVFTDLLEIPGADDEAVVDARPTAADPF